MKKILVASVLLIACGDNDIDHVCGMGTHDEGGVCVADDGSSCAPGTVLQDGMCVPDGSVICSQGRKFDPATGKCVLDPTACADGTVLVGDACVPDDDTLADMADHKEAAEPNDGDPNVAGMFAAPALNEDTTFYGCVTATTDGDGDGNLDADFDAWVVTASAPMVLEVTVDGTHGLSGGYVAVAAGNPALANWSRFGLNLTGDTAKREIYLPAAGTYALFVTDGRSLFLGQAGAGTTDTCYFGTVKQVALPAGTALSLPTTSASNTGKVQVFTFTATATGDIIDLSMNTASPAMRPAFVDLRGTTLHRSAAVISDIFGDVPPFDTIGGLDTGNVVTFVVDPEYNYGLSPQAYTLDAFRIGAQALPLAGGMITAMEKNGTTSGASYVDFSYAYFDVATAGLKHFALTASKPVDMVIVRRDLFTATGAFDFVANIDTFGGTGRAAFTGELVKFLTPGRYYFVTQNPAATMSGGTYTITSTVTDQATTAATYGTASNNVALANNNSFLTLDLTNPVWIELGITATADWGGNVAINSYDLASEGWLRTGTPPGTIPAGNIFPVFGGTQPATSPFAPLGRILANDTRDFLVRVQPTATPGAAPTYSLLPKDRTGLTNLGMLSAGMTMNTAMGVAPGAPKRYIALGTAGNSLRVLGHPTNALADLSIVRVNAAEGTIATFNSATVGGDETLTAPFPAAPGNWVAWTVNDLTAATTTDVDQTITVTAPRPYTITNGTLAFSDACTGGMTLGTPPLDDEIITGQTLPSAFSTFQLFGEAVPATFRVGANGWLSWDTGTVSLGAYQNRMIPTVGAPEGLLAPFWQDQDTITLCRKDDSTANTVTFQWTGRIYNSAGQNVQYQLVLHSNGVIDYIYGPNHVSTCAFADTDGNGCTVGAENLSGSFGHQIVYNSAMITASTSKTLTPM